MAPDTGRSPLPDPELRRLVRKGLEVKLPDDLARRVLERARKGDVPASRWWQTAAAAAACFAVAAVLLMMTLPEQTDRRVPPPDGGLVVTLQPEPGPAPSRLQYTVSRGGAIADQGHLELTRYAMDTVSVDALTPVTY